MPPQLAEPFGSPPKRAGQYALYFTKRGDINASMVLVFAAPYAARKCLDLVFAGDEEVVWDDDASEGTAEPNTTIVGLQSNIVASTRWWPERMEECVNHTYTLPELAWQMPAPYPNYILAFRHGIPERQSVQKKQRATREPRIPSTPRPSREGLTPVGTIADELGITPREARGALRDMQCQKPPQGWAFPPNEVEDWKAKIANHLGIEISQ